MVRFVTYECMFVIREIVETMVNAYTPRIFSGQKPVFDGREKLYSREPLPFGKDKVSLITYCTQHWHITDNEGMYVSLFELQMILHYHKSMLIENRYNLMYCYKTL